MPPLRKIAHWIPNPVLRPLRRLRNARARAIITGILETETQPDTSRAEADFSELQAAHDGVPEYGYEPFTAWRRGVERAVEVGALPANPHGRCRILEVGCGDGMAGFLLSTHGHDVVLSDMDDWRDPRAKQISFCNRVLEDGLPYPPETFDVIFSYNSFEHFADPAKCLAEITRLTKPTGTAFLSFGPLYASPWGMHAWSALRMPFPQYLFSESFIDSKLGEIGIHDLGKSMKTLQPLNKWRLKDFCDLWTSDQWKLLELDLCSPTEHLAIIEQYPECFSGRQLTFDDVVTQAIRVRLQRR